MKFVDLFAGLGGFHRALSKQGHECVFASEIDSDLAELYFENYGVRPSGDIRKSYLTVPKHDILCAGFPCQPFSKAGEQLGFECPQWGDLFGYVVKILERHQPRFLIIENVPNLMQHNEGRTWKRICARLRRAGYDIQSMKISPHLFGVPQIRDRAVIVGDRKGLKDFQWPSATHAASDLSIESVLDRRPKNAKKLSKAAVGYLKAWQLLLHKLPKDEQLPSFPIWAMEFGATYPYEGTAPLKLKPKDLARFRGSFGRRIKVGSVSELADQLPAYARGKKRFPDWKVQYIKQNREFYRRNRKVIDVWLPMIASFAPSFQKFEWNWKDGKRDLWSTVIQFRASGIRAKRPNAAPSLVALTTSQVPVIPWERRYMTMRECARLQSMGSLKLPSAQGATYKALGNAVNVTVIGAVLSQLTKARSKEIRLVAKSIGKTNSKPRKAPPKDIFLLAAE
jgi:DNA (cytosine-5)-methyltransferase 1